MKGIFAQKLKELAKKEATKKVVKKASDTLVKKSEPLSALFAKVLEDEVEM